MAAQSSADSIDRFAHGERRQITVMFCDLVGSTALSERLDPEDLSRLIGNYYTACRKIIVDGGGFVARLVGDGILAYFGYPEAREDAADSAIRASLRIIHRLAREHFEGGGQLDVHIGLATGMTVIGDIVGPHFAERNTVVGLTPNLAARIQALAPAGTVLVSDETRQLAGGMFTYADLGQHTFRGLEKPVRVWKVRGEVPFGLRFEAHHTQLFDFVGREAELRTLLDSWDLAQRGTGRIVAIRGEAGIGKSRLLREAAERLAPSPGWMALLQCSSYQASTPLHPLVAWIRREARVGGTDAVQDAERLAAWLGGTATRQDAALLGELVGIDLADAESVRSMLPDRKRSRTREILVGHFVRHCASGPVLFLLEDAHWMDGATEEFLRGLFDAMRQQRFLALITARPTGQRDWSDAGAVTEIRLQPLRAAEAEKLMRSAAGTRRLPPALAHLIVARADGVPLFIEELTATALESDHAAGQEDWPAAGAGLAVPDLPATLRDSLTARLDRLGSGREVARMASAIGREFSFSLLQRVTGQAPVALAAALDRLVDAQLLFRRAADAQPEYVFKHALVQQAAYESQLRTERRALHARIVDVIETGQPELAAREPGLMAHHCHEAGLPDKEVDYLYAAGLASTRLVAIPEALSCFSRACEVVAALPPTPHNVRRHIDILLGLMEVGRFAILPRRLLELGALARKLAGSKGVQCDAVTLSSILFQEARALLYSTRYGEARRLFTALRRLGREEDSPDIERRPGSALTMTLCCQGLFNESLEFMNASNLGHYKESGRVIDYIAGLGWTAYALCETGPGEQGLRFADLSVQEAEQLQSPIYVGGARIWRSHALMAARRFEEAVADARRCVELSEVHAVPYLGWHGLVFLALCLCRAGRFPEARATLGQARRLLDRVAQGQWSLLDYLPAIEAEIACFACDHARALALAEQAIASAQAVDGYFAEAIAWRVKAVSTIRTGGDPDAAQSLFDRAVRLHERGGARAEQAFATLSWSRALEQAGHAERARSLAALAREQARVHGFDLARCEFGAAAMA